MAKIKLRGESVEIRGRKIYLAINKSQAGMFSISDKIREYLGKGFTAKVMVDGGVRYLKGDTPYSFKERVKTKFPNASDWYRYWYSVDPVPEKTTCIPEPQLDFFSGLGVK